MLFLHCVHTFPHILPKVHSTGILQKLSEFGMIQVVRQFLHKERSMDMAQTTKNAIRKGFLDLLEQRPLDKISVVDIADHCGVNRNTFYYYYCDIYALVREVLETELDRVLNAPPLCTSPASSAGTS